MTSPARHRVVSTTGGPAVARTRDELTAAIGRSGGDRSSRPRVALVPTMGSLHAGHAALLDLARDRGDLLVASIFVNPLQFGPGEDLDRYPRTFDADLRLCAERGVDVVFSPSVDEVYPGGQPQVTVQPGPLGGILDGASRPGHFRGVLTVVAKLFGLVRPDIAVFGQKDYQQLVLVRRMVGDLCMPIDVLGAETTRDADGLALSSRNGYLSAGQRVAALALSRALRAGADGGPVGAEAVLSAAHDIIAAEPRLLLDYLALRGVDLDEPLATGPARLLVAANVGATRLIDNVSVFLGEMGRP